MAIKVRCQQCRKKISIDEGFVGGLCRCPYCKAITMVSGGAAAGYADRPDRPDLPTEVATSQARQVESVEAVEAVPQAKPVMIQGIATLVLSGFVLLLLVVGVVLVVKMSTGPKDGSNTATETKPSNNNDLPPIPIPTNPFTAKGLQVAGMGIAEPVVYVLNASSAMRDLYDPSVALVRYSIRAMGGAGQFNIIVLAEESVKPMAGAWITGGDAGDMKAKEFLRDCQPAGATDLTDGFRRAMALKPKTIVVLTDKAVNDADSLAQQAKQTGIKIFAVMLESPPDAVAVMEKLTAGTGGRCRQFTGSEIAELLSEAAPLP